MSIYIKQLSMNQEILLNLLSLIPIKDICKNIIIIKNIYEKKETTDYYNERWLNIAKEHSYLHENHMNKFSYILDSKKYIVKTDFKLDYYKYTGISYQIIELIHELIKLKNEKYITKDQGYEYWLKYDDKLYSLLSHKIMIEMKKL